MATYADGNRFGVTMTVPAAQVAATQANFPVLLTSANLPAAALDGGAQSIESGGGSLRAYLDTGAADPTSGTRYALEVVALTPGGSPSAEVWVCVPSLSSSVDNKIFLSWGGGGSQPAVGAAYGRNATWVSFTHVYHQGKTGTQVDATGSLDLTKVGGVEPTIVNGPVGKANDWPGAGNLAQASKTWAGGYLSVMAWAEAQAAGNNNAGINGMWSPTNVWALATQPASSSGFVWAVRTTTTLYSVVTATGLSGVKHLCGVARSGEIQLYVDSVAGTPTALPAQVQAATELMPIAGYGSGFAFNGILDEIRIGPPLSTADVLTHYRTQASPATFATAGTIVVPTAGGAALLWTYYGG